MRLKLIFSYLDCLTIIDYAIDELNIITAEFLSWSLLSHPLSSSRLQLRVLPVRRIPRRPWVPPHCQAKDQRSPGCGFSHSVNEGQARNPTSYNSYKIVAPRRRSRHFLPAPNFGRNFRGQLFFSSISFRQSSQDTIGYSIF